MIPARHNNQRLVALHLVHQPVLGIDSARPIALQLVLQWLGLADTFVWRALDIFYQIVDLLQCVAIFCLPVDIVIPTGGGKQNIHQAILTCFNLPALCWAMDFLRCFGVGIGCQKIVGFLQGVELVREIMTTFSSFFE